MLLAVWTIRVLASWLFLFFCHSTRLNLRGHPHRFGRSSAWILWTHFFETCSEGEKIAFSRGRRMRILCVLTAPSPRPSTSSLRPLNPATSRNNNNNSNNSGGLHACVRTAEDIEPIRVTRAKYYAPLPPRWAKKDYGQQTNHFHLLLAELGFSFYCLFVYSVKVLDACSVSSSPFLANFKRHL